jgi:hypothetical protein
VRDPSNRADHYRKEAAKYHALAKLACPAYLGDFYRRIAVRYLFMAEELSREAGRRCQVVSNQGGFDSEGYKMRMPEGPQTSVGSLEVEIRKIAVTGRLD